MRHTTSPTSLAHDELPGPAPLDGSEQREPRDGLSSSAVGARTRSRIEPRTAGEVGAAIGKVREWCPQITVKNDNRTSARPYISPRTSPPTPFPACCSPMRNSNPTHRPCARSDLGIWQTWSWTQAATEGARSPAGREPGFRSRRQPGDRRRQPAAPVFLAVIAAQRLRGVPVPLYQDAVASEMVFMLDDAAVEFVVVEDQEQVDKLLECRASAGTGGPGAHPPHRVRGHPARAAQLRPTRAAGLRPTARTRPRLGRCESRRLRCQRGGRPARRRAGRDPLYAGYYLAAPRACARRMRVSSPRGPRRRGDRQARAGATTS